MMHDSVPLKNDTLQCSLLQSSYSKCAVKVAFNVKTTCHCVPKLFGFHLSFLSKFVAEVGFNVNIKCNFLVEQVFLPFQITPNLLYMWLSI